MMRDPARSTFAYVMYPESTPIVEAARAMDELRTVGIEPGLVVANQVIPKEVCTTAYAQARREMQEKYLGEMRRRFRVPILTVPLLSREISGRDMLIDLGERVLGDGEGRDGRGQIVVRIIGVPTACAEGVTEAWKKVARQASAQLAARFGDRVRVEYYDLFAPEVDSFPEVLAKVGQGAQMPLVFVGSELLSSGGKVSVPAIAGYIDGRPTEG